MELVLDKKPKRPTIIEGFPGVGFVGTIATEFMLNHLNAKSIGYLFNPNLPPIAILHGKETRRLLEIFHAPKENLVFIHAISGTKGLEWEVAKAIGELSKLLNAKQIISLEGVVSPDNAETSRIFVKSNDYKSEKELLKLGAEKLDRGAVTGVTGALMLTAESVNSTFLFAETHSRMPDSHAAAELIRMLDVYLNLKVDPKPLIKQAEDFENKIKDMIKLGIDSQKPEDDESQKVNYLG